MLLVLVLCQTCVVAPAPSPLQAYFDGKAAHADLRLAYPCPRGTDIVENGRRTATCVPLANPNGESIEVEFYGHGGLRTYQTKRNGERHGAFRRFDDRGTVVEACDWRDGLRHGPYYKLVGKDQSESGNYDRGLKVGVWEEWVDDRRMLGRYAGGLRIGTWSVADTIHSKPHAHVQFSKDKVTVNAVTSDYQGLMLAIDGAWLAVGLLGYLKDNTALQIAGGVGLGLAGPAVHAW